MIFRVADATTKIQNKNKELILKLVFLGIKALANLGLSGFSVFCAFGGRGGGFLNYINISCFIA